MFNNNCNNNRCCFDPCQCQPEPCCCIGVTGPTGSTGSTGSTGPTGPAGGFAPAYGTFISNQVRFIDTNTNVPLDTVLSDAPVGIAFTPGSTTVSVLNAGVYKITYMMRTSSNTIFALIINGAVLPNSNINIQPHTSVTGTATITLAAGSTLGIINLTSGILVEEPTNAILDVTRIS